MTFLFAFLNKTISKVVGILALVLGIFGYGYFKGKKRENEYKHELEKTEEQLKQASKNIEKTQEISSKIEKNSKEVKKKIEEAKAKKKYNIGKWIVFFVFFFTVSCTKTEYIQLPCPNVFKLPRPELYQLEIYEGMVLDNDSLGQIITNLELLKGLIVNYEMMIDIINRVDN